MKFLNMVVFILTLLVSGCSSAPTVVMRGNQTVVGGFVKDTKHGHIVWPAPHFKLIVHNLTNHSVEIRRDGKTIALIDNGVSQDISFSCEPGGNQASILAIVYDTKGGKTTILRADSEVLTTRRDDSSYLFGSYGSGAGIRTRVQSWTMYERSTQKDYGGW